MEEKMSTSSRIKDIAIGFGGGAVLVASILSPFLTNRIRQHSGDAEAVSAEIVELEKRLRAIKGENSRLEQHNERLMDELVLVDVKYKRVCDNTLESRAMPESQPIPPKTEPSIALDDFLLVSSIDKNFNYVKRANSTYKRGELVTIYHKARNIKPVNVRGKYKISFSEKHELFDPDGKLVPGVTKANSYSPTTTVTSSEERTIPIQSGVNTLALTKPGTYTYRISIVDQFNPSNKDVKEIKFDLRIPTYKYPIAIRNLVFASSIDDNYNYVERGSSDFTFGDTVWIYYKAVCIKAVKLPSGGYTIGSYSNVELRDPDGEIVEWVHNENSLFEYKPVSKLTYYSVKIKSEIDTSRLTKPGTYTYIIRLSNTEVADVPVAQKQIKFKIK